MQSFEKTVFRDSLSTNAFQNPLGPGPDFVLVSWDLFESAFQDEMISRYANAIA